MNTQANAVPESPLNPQGSAPAEVSVTQPMYWSARRELWENRSIYFASLAVAGVYLFGHVISVIWRPRGMREIWMPASMHEVEMLKPADQLIDLAMPYTHAAMLLMLVGFIVGFFYCLDALYGERRDRSILFWKSMPVSDLTVVLSKASVALVILPVIVFAVTVALQQIMRLLSVTILGVTGAGAGTLWTGLPLFQLEIVLLYSIVVVALWHAPIYCWLLLVSGWARRATFLWAVLPPLALAAVENIAFHTSFLGSLLHNRLLGFTTEAFNLKDKNGLPTDAHFIALTQITPGRLFSSPSLWLGLAVAAIFLAAAVRLRRDKGPI
jgi:ABC-2 type transport system permease protein